MNADNTQAKGMSQGQRKLLSLALQYLGDANGGRLATYAYKVRSQMAMMDSLTVEDWVKMARILTEQAIKKNIQPHKIANAIYPLVSNLGYKARFLALLPPHTATERLLKFTGAPASEEIQSFLAGVVEELQQMILQPDNNL